MAMEQHAMRYLHIECGKRRTGYECQWTCEYECEYEYEYEHKRERELLMTAGMI